MPRTSANIYASLTIDVAIANTNSYPNSKFIDAAIAIRSAVADDLTVSRPGTVFYRFFSRNHLKYQGPEKWHESSIKVKVHNSENSFD